VVSRSAGLLAHAVEELETETMPHVWTMVTDAVAYRE
jgi:hypothetical protein